MTLPANLDEVRGTPGLEVHWDGPAGERILADGLIERSRPFTVTIEAGREPGPRAAEVTIHDGPTLLLGHRLQVEITDAIKPSPAGIIFDPGPDADHKTIVLRSQDGRVFGVTGIESTIAGIRGEADSSDQRTIHRVQVTSGPNQGGVGSGGVLHIKTDHPLQSTVSLGFFIRSRSSEPPSGGGQQ